MFFLYDIFIWLYGLGIAFWSLFNSKAKKWREGRKGLWHNLQTCTRQGKVIWFHCASLGEYEQALPLIEAVKKNAGNTIHVLVTFFSPSGYENKKLSSSVDEYAYLPLDTKKNARKFLAIVQPEKVYFIKYEFWYNFIDALHKKGISFYLVAGIFRKQQVFFRKCVHFFRAQLAKFTFLFVQDTVSKDLLAKIGIHQVEQCGDTRFDRVAALRDQFYHNAALEQFIAGRKVLVAGSTWPPDEKLLKGVLERLEQNWCLVIAPHELSPNHLRNIEQLFGNAAVKLSELNSRNTLPRVLLLDCMGILSLVYRYADICYVGGGFGRGIHNTLEALVYGKAVLFGPNHHKFSEAKMIIQQQMGACVTNEKETYEKVQYFSQIQTEIQKKIDQFFAEHTRAVEKILRRVEN